jgi:recombinase
VQWRVLQKSELFSDVQFFGAQFDGVALIAPGGSRNLTISSAAALMSLASATVRWSFTAANRVIIRSVRHTRQTATCHRIGASPSGHPTTASVGPPQQKVHWWTRSPPTAFHRRGPGVRSRKLRGRFGQPIGVSRLQSRHNIAGTADHWITDSIPDPNFGGAIYCSGPLGLSSEHGHCAIAASKRKGIWMGGVVPLGYRVENRALYVVEEHAVFVRDLYRRYLEIGSVVRLKPILDHEDARLPLRTEGTGKTIGGGLISRGHLYKILSNPIYLGRLTHKGQAHDGLHGSQTRGGIRRPDAGAGDRSQGRRGGARGLVRFQSAGSA